MRRNKQAAALLVNVSAADFGPGSACLAEKKEKKNGKTRKNARALHRIEPSYSVIQHNAPLKLLTLVTRVGVDKRAQSGSC